MPRSNWINPASRTYQVRRWAQQRALDRLAMERAARGPGGGAITPDPGTQTENVRVDPGVADVAYVTTSVGQPYGGDPLVLFPSSLVRPDLITPGVVYLTVTETGP